MNTLTIGELIEKGIPFTENIGLYIFTAFMQLGNAYIFIAPIVITWLLIKAIKRK